jgi:hypothetical protein
MKPTLSVTEIVYRLLYRSVGIGGMILKRGEKPKYLEKYVGSATSSTTIPIYTDLR